MRSTVISIYNLYPQVFCSCSCSPYSYTKIHFFCFYKIQIPRKKIQRCPVLIIHGTNDNVVPFWHGDELLRSFPPEYRAKPFWVNGLGHNHIEIKRRDEYVRRINSFIEMYVISQKNRKNGINNNDTNTSTSTNTSKDNDRTRNRVPAIIPEEEQYKPATSLKESGKFVVNQTWMKHGLEIVSEAIQDKKDKNKKKLLNNEKIVQKKNEKIQNEITRTEQPIHSTTTTTRRIYEEHRERQSPPPPPPPPPPPTMIYHQEIEKLSSDSRSYHESKHQTNIVKTVSLKRLSTNDLVMKAKKAEDENKSAIRAKREIDTSSHISQSSSFSFESAASRFLLTKESWGTDEEEQDVSFDDDYDSDAKENFGGGVSLQTFTNGDLSGFSLQSSFNHDACEISLCRDDDDEGGVNNSNNSIGDAGVLLPKSNLGQEEFKKEKPQIDRYSCIY